MTPEEQTRGQVVSRILENSEESPEATQSRTASKKNASKSKQKPTTFIQLLESAYLDPKSIDALTVKDLEQITLDSSKLEEAKVLLLDLAPKDPFLQVPVVLLGTILVGKKQSVLSKTTFDFAVSLLSSHPALKNFNWTNDSNFAFTSSQAEHLEKLVANLRFEDFGMASDAQLTDAMRSGFKTNVFSAFELVGYLKNLLTIEEIIYNRARFIWAQQLKEDKARSVREIFTRSNSRETKTFANLSVHLLREKSRELDERDLVISQLQEQILGLTNSLDSLDEKLQAKLRDNAELSGLLEEALESNKLEKDLRVSDQILGNDRYETLRRKVNRSLAEQRAQLSETVTALRNGYSEIAEEYLDWVLGKMDQTISDIKLEDS